VDRFHAGWDRDASAGDRAAFVERGLVALDLRDASSVDRFDSSLDRVGAKVDRVDAARDRQAAQGDRARAAEHFDA
jgi:hypothetical protein